MISPDSSAPLTRSASPTPAQHPFLQLFVLPSCCELIQFLSTDKTSEFNVTMRQLNGNKNNSKNNNNSATATTSITMATLAIIMDDAADPAPTSSTKKASSAWATLHIEGNGESDSNLVSISLSNNASPRWQSMVQCLVPALRIACSFCLLS